MMTGYPSSLMETTMTNLRCRQLLSMPKTITMNLLLMTVLLFIQSTLGFAPPSHRHVATLHTQLQQKTRLQSMQRTSFEPSETILATLTQAIKRPRGLSIGIEYASSTQHDVSILSMQLRKCNARAIYTSNLSALVSFRKEQETARGDFPGPVPVIYWGECWREAVELGTNVLVLDYDSSTENSDLEMLVDHEVCVIWKVSEIAQIQILMEKHFGNVFLLSDELLFNRDSNNQDTDIEQLQQQLSAVPESAVLIAALPSMLPQNHELTMGKVLSSTERIASLLIKRCCVDDDEDMKYAQFVIDGITKKSSSTFSMTGLTGSTNGHFGVSSHAGEVKWRRKLA